MQKVKLDIFGMKFQLISVIRTNPYFSNAMRNPTCFVMMLIHEEIVLQNVS